MTAPVKSSRQDVHRRGGLRGAIDGHTLALRLKERLLGLDHPLPRVLVNLGAAYRRLGRSTVASLAARRAEAIPRPLVAPDHPTLSAARAGPGR